MVKHYFIRDIPLFGCIAFGIIDRGTNILQVRPISECPLSCIFCSTDAGAYSKNRLSEYMVELEQLLTSFEWAASYKKCEIEAHIDTVGEPLMYPYIVELVKRLSDNPYVKIVSMQSNGILLNEKLMNELEAGLSRINISIDAMNPQLAKRIAGVDSYNLERVMENARYIAQNTNIDLLIAPVWLPGINDKEIPRLIEFALSIGAGKRWPAMGIQKYIPHKYGRKPDVKVMRWDAFYSQLEKWENEYSTKLVLRPEDFGSYRCKPLPRFFKRYEKVKVKVAGYGWMQAEKLGVAKDRVITILNAQRIPVGKQVYVKIVRTMDGIYLAKPM